MTYIYSGLKGVYSSKTVEGAARFICQYTNILNARYGIIFFRVILRMTKHHKTFTKSSLQKEPTPWLSIAVGVFSFFLFSFHFKFPYVYFADFFSSFYSSIFCFVFSGSFWSFYLWKWSIFRLFMKVSFLVLKKTLNITKTLCPYLYHLLPWEIIPWQPSFLYCWVLLSVFQKEMNIVTLLSLIGEYHFIYSREKWCFPLESKSSRKFFAVLFLSVWSIPLSSGYVFNSL